MYCYVHRLYLQNTLKIIPRTLFTIFGEYDEQFRILKHIPQKNKKKVLKKKY